MHTLDSAPSHRYTIHARARSLPGHEEQIRALKNAGKTGDVVYGLMLQKGRRAMSAAPILTIDDRQRMDARLDQRIGATRPAALRPFHNATPR